MKSAREPGAKKTQFKKNSIKKSLHSHLEFPQYFLLLVHVHHRLLHQSLPFLLLPQPGQLTGRHPGQLLIRMLRSGGSPVDGGWRGGGEVFGFQPFVCFIVLYHGFWWAVDSNDGFFVCNLGIKLCNNLYLLYFTLTRRRNELIKVKMENR